MKANTHLVFDGRCAAALSFYEQHLGARTFFRMSYGESPIADQFPPEFRAAIVHAAFELGDATFMAADAMPGQYAPPAGITVTLTYDTPEQTEQAFHALAQGGRVTMPLQQTFWSPLFAMLTDQFGTPWLLSTQPQG